MNGLPTPSDVELVKSYLLLPILLNIIERDRKLMQQPNALKMPKVYIRKLVAIQDKITADISAVRKRMKRSNVKVYDHSWDNKSIRSKYLCRGYHHSMELLWLTTKADLEILLASYLGVDLADENS